MGAIENTHRNRSSRMGECEAGVRVPQANYTAGRCVRAAWANMKRVFESHKQIIPPGGAFETNWLGLGCVRDKPASANISSDVLHSPHTDEEAEG